MKRSDPFPSLASILAEGQKRQRKVTPCCDGAGAADGQSPSLGVVKQLELPALSPRRMGEPRKGGPPRAWGQPTDGDCGCKHSHPSPAPEPEEATERVSGDWVARLLRPTSHAAAAMSGRQLEVDTETLGALRAIAKTNAARSATQGRVSKARKKAFGVFGAKPDPLGRVVVTEGGGTSTTSTSISTRCDCESSITAGVVFVDSENGNDYASGTYETTARGSVTIKPWRTLYRVQVWLDSLVSAGASSAALDGAQIYLRRDRVWDGTTEMDRARAYTAPPWSDATTMGTALTLDGLKGLQTSPIVIGNYYPLRLTGSRAAMGNLPRIDGSLRSEAGALYGDSRVGIYIRGCCHVYMNGVAVRAFGRAVQVRGGSKHHTYHSLELYDNAICGMHIAAVEDDVKARAEETVAEQITGALSDEEYPEDITVDGCTMWSNGYDTAGADIGLGFLATSCTISNNTLTGDGASSGPRGVDGVVAQYASSGHLIENNRISAHRMWCHADGSDTQMVSSTSCPGYAWVLQQSCSLSSEFSTTGVVLWPLGSCLDTDYGYAIQPTYSPDPDSGDSAFGEDGIDLKGVRSRTTKASKQTIVRGNVIWGHRNQAGIAIADGSQNVYVYRNRIFQNRNGVSIANGNNSGWYIGSFELEYYNLKTENIYVYRNVIYMNEGRGVVIESADDDKVTAIDESTGDEVLISHVFEVAGVYLVNNTIAHNLLAGVLVSNQAGTAGDEVTGIFLYNNLIARNGIDGDYGSGEADAMQLAWTGEIDLSDTTSYASRHNCFLGWYRISGTLGEKEAVIRWRSEVRTLADAQSDWSDWFVEDGSQQVSLLESLDFDPGAPLIVATEGSDPASPALHDSIWDGDPETLAAVDYSIGCASQCLDAGLDSTGAYESGSTTDIAMSADFDSTVVSDDTPDVGAFEGPPPEDCSISVSTWAVPASSSGGTHVAVRHAHLPHLRGE